jgi:hypothetical protein
MGSLFSSKAPAPTPPPAPIAPAEEAEFKPGGSEEVGRKKLKTLASGKKRLQIPLTKTGAKQAVQTGK